MLGNRQRNVRAAKDTIEEILASYQEQEAWKRITSWYRQESGGKYPPSRERLGRIVTERTDLYRCRIPERLRVPILVTTETVEDGILEEAVVAQAVQGLKRGSAGGPSGMRTEDLKVWLREASRETNPVKHRWQLLVRLIQKNFEYGVVPDEVA